MSEYWKSTPKYWCKFCKTFVRDTKNDRTQHEAKGFHQANIQRSIRTLQREQERGDREKQRAKDEVARLNSIVSGAPAPCGKLTPWIGTPSRPSGATEARPEERKTQVAQLAALGVAVPEQYRREMAMVGEWENVAEHPVDPPGLKHEEDSKTAILSYGVRKRKHEGMEEEEEAGAQVVRKGWGTMFKAYPGAATGSEDIASLLSSGAVVVGGPQTANDKPVVKKEEGVDENVPLTISAVPEDSIPQNIQALKDPLAPPVIFKKRKAKVNRAIR